MSVEQAVQRFSTLLDSYPAGFSGNRLNLLLLDDAKAIHDGPAYLRQLDGLSLLHERREYLLDEQAPWPFPRLSIDARPDPWVISERLFLRFAGARQVLLTQGAIAERIEYTVRRQAPSVVALLIVDGLSYYDLPAESGAEPCLVEGITITEYGYRQVVGQPSLSRRLFALGYTDQVGFTYFDPEANTLSAQIHQTFSPSQMVRVTSFDEVLRDLAGRKLRRGYIQVTLAGLDQLCHAHWDRPPREHYLQRVLAHYHDLIECLAAGGRSVLAVLTADHGILWREEIENRLEVADDLFREDLRSPRYIRGSVPRAYGLCCRCDGQNYTLLRAPWLTRRLRSNEWGVHGGISAWESLVPFLAHHA